MAKRCPCGGFTHVVEVRITSKNRTKRRRQCDACGARYSTYEITVDDYAKLAKRTVDARKRVVRYLNTVKRMLD